MLLYIQCICSAIIVIVVIVEPLTVVTDHFTLSLWFPHAMTRPCRATRETLLLYSPSIITLAASPLLVVQRVVKIQCVAKIDAYWYLLSYNYLFYCCNPPLARFAHYFEAKYVFIL